MVDIVGVIMVITVLWVLAESIGITAEVEMIPVSIAESEVVSTLLADCEVPGPTAVVCDEGEPTTAALLVVTILDVVGRPVSTPP
jgi:hypothetical protein